MKKALTIITTLILAVAMCLSFTACDGSNVGGNVINKQGIKYRLNKGEYTVTGYVAEKDFDGTLSIPAEVDGKPVTAIKEGAFSGNSNIVNLTVPTSVTEIGAKAFAGMTKLATLTIPFVGKSAVAYNAERTLGYTFSAESYKEGVMVSGNYNPDASALNNYYLPKTLATINVAPAAEYNLPAYAFDGVRYVNNITLNNFVKTIGDAAFRNCENLLAVEGMENATEIGASAFENCKRLAEVELGANLTRIGASAFKGVKVATIVIPDAVVYVGNYAFAEMTELVNVTFGAGYTEILQYTFKDCTALVTVTSQYVEWVAPNAFYGCNESLKTNFPLIAE